MNYTGPVQRVLRSGRGSCCCSPRPDAAAIGAPSAPCAGTFPFKARTWSRSSGTFSRREVPAAKGNRPKARSIVPYGEKHLII